jgi:hypothetical protein
MRNQHRPNVKRCGHLRKYKCACNTDQQVEDQLIDVFDYINKKGKRLPGYGFEN